MQRNKSAASSQHASLHRANSYRQVASKIMPTYKLTYFPVEAKGELIRLVFKQTGTEFEDVRISPDSWPAMKPTTQFGYLPTLDIDGETVSGSSPIARHIAEKHGLAGANEIENLKLAGIKDFQDEVVLKMARAYFEKDEAKKEEMKAQVVKEFIPKYLTTLERIINDNPAGQGWLFGAKVTYVDLFLYLIVEFMKLFKEDAVAEYPAVEKCFKAVTELPNVAQWLKERPPRTFGPPVA